MPSSVVVQRVRALLTRAAGFEPVEERLRSLLSKLLAAIDRVEANAAAAHDSVDKIFDAARLSASTGSTDGDSLARTEVAARRLHEEIVVSAAAKRAALEAEAVQTEAAIGQACTVMASARVALDATESYADVELAHSQSALESLCPLLMQEAPSELDDLFLVCGPTASHDDATGESVVQVALDGYRVAAPRALLATDVLLYASSALTLRPGSVQEIFLKLADDSAHEARGLWSDGEWAAGLAHLRSQLHVTAELRPVPLSSPDEATPAHCGTAAVKLTVDASVDVAGRRVVLTVEFPAADSTPADWPTSADPGFSAMYAVLSVTVHQSTTLVVAGAGGGIARALVDDVVRAPQMAMLCARDCRFGSSGAREIAESLLPHAGHIQRLFLDGNVLGDGGAASLAGGLVHVPGLRVLTVRNCDIGHIGCAALAASLPSVPLLEMFAPGDNPVGADGVLALCASLRHGALSRLSVLNLDGCEVDIAAVRELASTITSGHIPHLTELQCNGMMRSWSEEDFGDDGVAALAPALRCMPQLTMLSLVKNQLTATGLRTVAAALPSVPLLKTLYLGGNYAAGGAVADALVVGLRSVPCLERLSLWGVCMGDDGAIALADALVSFPRLQVLDVTSCGIADPGMSALAGALRHVPSLISLTVNGNACSAAGVRRLADALGHVMRLECLNVSALQLEGGADDADAAQALLLSAIGRLHRLDDLDLSYNQVVSRGAAEALRASLLQLPRLRSLGLRRVCLNDAGARDVAAGLAGTPRLSQLSIAENTFGLDGAGHLSTAIGRLRQLGSLVLSTGRRRDVAVRAASSAPPGCVVKILDS